jgi:hypothetical protein
MVLTNINEIMMMIERIIAHKSIFFKLKIADNCMRSTITRYKIPEMINPPKAPSPCNSKIANLFSSVKGNDKRSGTSLRFNPVDKMDIVKPRNWPINIPAKNNKTRIIREYQGFGASLSSGFLVVVSIIGVNLHL